VESAVTSDCGQRKLDGRKLRLEHFEIGNDEY